MRAECETVDQRKHTRVDSDADCESQDNRGREHRISANPTERMRHILTPATVKQGSPIHSALSVFNGTQWRRCCLGSKLQLPRASVPDLHRSNHRFLLILVDERRVSPGG